jgi:hypothetical protein
MKKGKTISLNLFRDAKCYYGSVDTTDLKSIYIVIQTWVVPKEERGNWNLTVGSISRTIKHKILNICNRKLFKDNFIVDMDLRTSGIKLSKSSFLNLEITLFLKEPCDFKSEKIKNEVELIMNDIHNNILSKSKYFDIQLSKDTTKNKNFI